MTLGTFFLTHWFQFNYAPKGQPWYYGADWPNVFVLLPLFLLGMIPFLWHHYAVKDLHRKVDELAAEHMDAAAHAHARGREHLEHLKLILDALDPETDGGLQLIRAHLEHLLDAVDVETPGGLAVVVAHVDSLKGGSSA